MTGPPTFSNSKRMEGVLDVQLQAGKAMLKLRGRALPVEQPAPGRLTAMNGGVSLDFDAARESATLTLLGSNGGTFRRVQRPSASAADAAELAGTYRSAELNTTWTIRADGSALVLHGRAIGDNPLEPVMRDGFMMPNGFLRVTRGADGRINGFDVSASRMKRIRFDR